jgi:hypothetical protein
MRFPRTFTQPAWHLEIEIEMLRVDATSQSQGANLLASQSVRRPRAAPGLSAVHSLPCSVWSENCPGHNLSGYSSSMLIVVQLHVLDLCTRYL